MIAVIRYGDVEIRHSCFQDIIAIFPIMRESDRDEIWASNGVTPYKALCLALEKSDICMTATLKGHPFAMFGISLGTPGTIWMLGTDKVKEIKHDIIRISKDMINLFLKVCPVLHNYVHAENKSSVRWLKKCGATIEEAKPFGFYNELFHHFTFKEAVKCATQQS